MRAALIATLVVLVIPLLGLLIYWATYNGYTHHILYSLFNILILVILGAIWYSVYDSIRSKDD